MAFTTDVRLPLEQAPVFPSQCVVCGTFQPDGFLVASRRGLWRSGGNPVDFIRRLRRKPFRTQAPACSQCLASHARHRILLRTGEGIGFAMAVALLMLVQRHFRPTWWSKSMDEELMTIGAVLALIAFYLPFEYFFPVAFDIVVDHQSILYEFRDGAYAEKFARLNRASVDD